MGQRAIPYFNPETREITYKYVASPMSSHERLDMLEAAFNVMLMGAMEEEEE